MLWDCTVRLTCPDQASPGTGERAVGYTLCNLPRKTETANRAAWMWRRSVTSGGGVAWGRGGAWPVNKVEAGPGGGAGPGLQKLRGNTARGVASRVCARVGAGPGRGRECWKQSSSEEGPRGRGLRCRKFTGQEERGGAGPVELGGACVGRSLVAEVWSDAEPGLSRAGSEHAQCIGPPPTPALQCVVFSERLQVAVQGPPLRSGSLLDSAPQFIRRQPFVLPCATSPEAIWRLAEQRGQGAALEMLSVLERRLRLLAMVRRRDF